jgi:hypothetical protein
VPCLLPNGLHFLPGYVLFAGYLEKLLIGFRGGISFPHQVPNVSSLMVQQHRKIRKRLEKLRHVSTHQGIRLPRTGFVNLAGVLVSEALGRTAPHDLRHHALPFLGALHVIVKIHEILGRLEVGKSFDGIHRRIKSKNLVDFESVNYLLASAIRKIRFFFNASGVFASFPNLARRAGVYLADAEPAYDSL